MAESKLCNLSSCTQCGACRSACRHDAISFARDSYGFAYPQIDADRCIDCNLCVEACPILSASPYENSDAPSVFALYSKDKFVVNRSSSGGVFFELAKYTIENGGVVFGVVSNNRQFYHTSAVTLEEVEPMLGSKYVQSDTGECYRQAKEFLDKGRRVLYTGTPCQIAGLKSFLKKRYDTLTTCEVICHGVPSLQILHRMMKLIDREEWSEIKYRDTKVWSYLSVIKKSDSRKESLFWKNDIYMKTFFRMLTYKPSCYICPFAKLPRVADLTIGDFWGIKDSKTFKHNPHGTSLMLVNSEHGNDIWKRVESRFILESRSLEEALRINANLYRPSPKPSDRDEFLNDLFFMRKRELESKYYLGMTLRNVAGHLYRRIKAHAIR